MNCLWGALRYFFTTNGIEVPVLIFTITHRAAGNQLYYEFRILFFHKRMKSFSPIPCATLYFCNKREKTTGELENYLSWSCRPHLLSMELDYLFIWTYWRLLLIPMWCCSHYRGRGRLAQRLSRTAIRFSRQRRRK